MQLGQCSFEEFKLFIFSKFYFNILLRLNQMLYALCLSYHSNTEAVLFARLSSGWATIPLSLGNEIE